MHSNIGLIMRREYLTRVRRRSFLLMSVLGPVMVALFYGITFWGMTSQGDTKYVQVIDESGLFAHRLPSSPGLHFEYIEISLQQVDVPAMAGHYDALLHIPALDVDNPQGIVLYAEGNVSAPLLRQLRTLLRDGLRHERLLEAGLSEGQIALLDREVSLQVVNLEQDAEGSPLGASMVGFAGAFTIYFFIFLYSAQVMRSVLEEKSSRIVEVIVSTVRPVELMMGKILGMAGVGLTQALLWLLLGGLCAAGLWAYLQAGGNPDMGPALQQSALQADMLLSVWQSVRLPLLLAAFLAYFFLGFLLYASLFAAIGAAVDSETETQQFMLPVTMPLILSVALSGAIIADPHGLMARLLSLFPLTAPVAMMIRLPFLSGVGELLLSLLLLAAGVLCAILLAARIYRVGILMHGKKASYAAIWHWLRRY